MRLIDRPSVVMGDRVVEGVDFVRAVLETAVEAAKRRQDGRPDEFRLCHDPLWGPARLEPLREAATAAAARQGWSGLRVLLVPAPVAIATHVAATEAPISVDHWLAVYDLGAESFTAAVVRREAYGFELIAANGLGVGGRTLDERLLAHVGGRLAARFDDWSHLVYPPPDDLRWQRAAHDLRSGLRRARERLSRYESAVVYLPELNEDIEISRGEFEAIIRPELRSTADLLKTTIDDARQRAGLSDERGVGVVLVGGSSRIPLVARLVGQSIAVPDPKGAVVLGAARLPNASRDTDVTVGEPPSAGQPGIFICYRREDSRWPARSLADALRLRFGSDRVFMDVDEVGLGKWREQIDDALAACRVVIVVIGPKWLDEMTRRADRTDEVRYEIAQALRMRKLIVPATLDPVKLPPRTGLPDDIAGLVEEEAYRLLEDELWQLSVERLINALAAGFDG